MEQEKQQARSVIRSGAVELSQDGAKLVIRHYGKHQTVEVEIDAAALERWALRQLREGVFT
jgi:hypothetical protein